MVGSEFWESWKRKTKLEAEAIKSLKIAKKIILENIPKKEIVSIYVKGSFIRREMNEKSDVDTLIILKESKMLGKLLELDNKYKDELKPKVQFTGYSLWELENDKKAKIGKVNRPGPARTVQHLEHYKLIYGRALKKEDFNQGDNAQRLKNMLYVFRTIFLPGYGKKEIGFSDIIKQVFWLVENEQRLKGKNPPYHFGKLAKSVKDKEHIVHDALRFRLKPTKDIKERANFIIKLKKYLKELERLL